MNLSNYVMQWLQFFYIENSQSLESGKNLKELVSLLRGVLKKDGGDIVRAILTGSMK